MMNRLLLLLVLLGLALPLKAAETTLTMVTDIGSSARMVSLGGVEGFGESAESIFDNPAALFRVGDQSYSLFHTQFGDGDVTVLNGAYATRLYGGHLAVGLYQSTVSDIAYTTRASNQSEIVAEDRFNYENAIYKAGYQFFFGEISYGLSLTLFNQTIHEDAGSGYNMDFGMIWQTQGFDWALSLKNFLSGARITYDGDKTDGDTVALPRQLSLSTRRTFSDLSLYGQLKYHQEVEASLMSAAIEYHPQLMSIPVTASIGWGEFASAGAVYNKVTMGVGLTLMNYAVNIAFEKSDYVAQDQQYYLSTHFTF